ncbi:MAG: imidazolonepropionase [Tannerellaceae bacterium]|jgi:imidazolonepropionase|nr:imidazolonepropionase [Tannerellaceae bacterium]
MKKKYLIRHISELVTCAGKAPKCGKEMADIGIINDGTVVVADERIEAVGTTDELAQRYRDTEGYEVIEAAGKTVLPGFVDSHTHFIFGGYRAEEFGWRLGGMTYMEIMQRGGGISNTVRATHAASLEQLIADGRERLLAMLAFGVTTVEGKSGYGLDKACEIRQLEAMQQLNGMQPIDIVPTFLGPHAIPEAFAGRPRAYLEYIVSDVLPEVRERRLAEFADIFCEDGVFSVEDAAYYLNAAKRMGFALKLHADEIVPFGGTELAADVGAVSADHLLKASDEGIRRLAAQGVVATLLPATAFCLKEGYARGREMIDAGCAVALASDFNPGSCFTHSIPLIISLACIYMHLTVEEVISALTINGAAALGKNDSIGSLELGKKADLLILKRPSIHFLPYCTGLNLVETVMKNGNIVL